MRITEPTAKSPIRNIRYSGAALRWVCRQMRAEAFSFVDRPGILHIAPVTEAVQLYDDITYMIMKDNTKSYHTMEMSFASARIIILYAEELPDLGHASSQANGEWHPACDFLSLRHVSLLNE